jgi:hypothetical protein
MPKPNQPKGLPETQKSVLDAISMSELLDYLNARMDTAQELVDDPKATVSRLRERFKELTEVPPSARDTIGDFGVFIDSWGELDEKTVIRYETRNKEPGYGTIVIGFKDGRSIELEWSQFNNDLAGWVLDDLDPNEILSITKIQR